MKSKIRKILQLVLTFVMLLSFSLCVACGDDDGEFEEETLSYELTVREGETRYLDFYAVSNGAFYEISVSDTSVISVDAQTGKMDAHKVGSSVITQTFGVTTATWNITVVESNFVPEVEEEEVITGNQDLDIAVPYLKTTVGGITTVSSVIKFVNAEDLTWSVENANVIKIVPSTDKKSCQVIGLAVGNSKLYLSNGVIKDVIDVEVKAPKDTHVQDVNKNTVVKFDTISLKTKVGVVNVIRLVTDENVQNAVWSIVSGNDFVSIATSADNKECYVNGLAVGVATIKAQIGDYFAECQVSVASDSLITLGAVELSKNENTLSWTAVPNASGYEYSSDGGYRWEDVPNGALSYTVPQDYPSGKYTFMIRAKGDGLNYKSGAYDTADIITSLYTEINLDTKKVSWTEYQGASSYSIFVNGQETVLNSGDYTVVNGVASYVVSDLSRNEEIYVSANGKNSNTVYYIGSDLGLVVLYSGVGNSNPNPMFITHESVSSVKINGVEKPFLVEDGKVSVQEYSGVEFGKKLPVELVVGGKTINSNKVFVDRVLYSGNSNYVSPEANFVNNLNTNYYFKNKAINKIADKQYEFVVNDASSLVVEVAGVTITRSAKELLERKTGEIETLFVKINEYSVEKVRIGVATAPIVNGDQIANLTYVSEKKNIFRGGDYDGLIMGFASGETYVLADNIDMDGMIAVNEFTQVGLSAHYYSSWGFLGTLDGNGHSVYNLTSSLFILIGENAVVKNLGVYASLSSGSALSRFNFNGKVDNCYFDIRVTKQASSAISAVSDSYITHEQSVDSNGKVTPRDKTPYITNSFINVTIDPDCTQSVYAIGKNVYGTDFTHSIVTTTNYENTNAMYTLDGGAPEVAPTLIGDSISQSAINAFLAQSDINHGAFKIDSGVLKFYYTRPAETNYDLIYPLYKFNADYSGRVANTEGIEISGYEPIPASRLTSVTPGNSVSIIVRKDQTEIVTVNVKVVTGVISTAQELSRMINLSVDEKPSGNWMQWAGYYVLANDIDMTGMSISKNTLPESNSATSYPSYGFAGTIDGAGYTISNLSDMMFYQLGNWSATIKNLSFINLAAPIANGLGCLTIDNCYFHIVRDSQYKFTSYVYDHIIGGTLGDVDYPRTFKMTNTVVRVENNTADKLYLVNNFINGSIVNFENVILVADSEKVGITTTALDTSITDKVTIIGLDDTFTGDKSVYNSVIWNLDGKHPTFKTAIYGGEVANNFAYGRHTTVDGVRVENTAPFVGKVAPGVTVTWDGAKELFLTKDSIGNYTKSPGYSLKTMLKASDGKYYKVNILLANVAISTAEDLKNMMISTAGAGQPNACTGQTIMLNGDIDMAGITDISYSNNPGYTETAWGFAGTFDGNGYTISNLEASLITLMNASGTIKNVTFKNVKAGKAVVGSNGGGKLNNVKFDIDATGASEIFVYATDGGARLATTITDCEIVVRNASSTTNIYFEKGLYSNGSININNVKVTTNDGNFYWAGSNATTDLNRTGAVNETFTGTVTPPTV